MESGFPKLVFGEHGDGSWERFIEEMNLCIESAVERRGYEGEGGDRRPIMRGRARDRREVGYDRRGSSRRLGGSRDSSYERYGSRDISRERYRGRESPREMRDKSSRYRDKSMDRFEGEKYKERCETSQYDERYRDNNDVELQNLTNKSDRESEVKRGHTGQDWCTCKTKEVKSGGYVEIGSQQGTARGARDVRVSMGCDREQSHDEVREAEISSNGRLDREGHEKKVAAIEREEREVRRKSKEKLAKLKAKREAAVMELENVKAFRVVVQELAEVRSS
ncbi:pre-mRNA-splicing factor 38B-like [Watersipora subatra]|uniref:pre-mRNA-splicing factor 38B-like n=1 Tax=Watersipora subatra TaxID=2589382 RepID=UPI00355BC9E2